MGRKRVVVTGMGIVSCFGSDVDKFYANLLAGKSGIAPIDRFDVSEYPTRFAGQVRDFEVEGYLDRKQARRVDPFIQYAIVAGKKALEMGALNEAALEKLDKTRCGIVIGSGMGGMTVFSDNAETLVTKGFKRISPFFVPYIETNMAGGLLAIDLKFMGPNYSISTACATSNHSIYSAAEHIRKGDADLMLCGGAEAAIIPIGVAGFVACKALSERNDEPQKASRPWDKGRDGFVMGEGSGVLLLESLEHALARGATIYAEYLGGGMSCDGYHMTDPREDGLGVSLCIEHALKDAGISHKQINYINAHATSTIAGDLREIQGIKNVFKEDIRNVKITSTKSMVGHCLGAAGGIEAIATIKAIQTGELAPTINIENLEEAMEGIDVVPNRSIKFDITAALSNSFGFGGHNSTLIFAPYTAREYHK
jgi:3-oxoacyl-[acyl-carrier-protein] synthase II